MRRFLRDRRAAEMMEFALTVPIVLVIVVGMLQMAVVGYASQMAKEAARHGARTGSVAQDDPAGRAYYAAYTHAASTFAVSQPQVQILAPGGVTGSELRVRVTFVVPNYFSAVGRLLPGLPSEPFVVFGEATARQEGW